MEILINMMDYLTKTTEVANGLLVSNFICWGMLVLLNFLRTIK